MRMLPSGYSAGSCEPATTPPHALAKTVCTHNGDPAGPTAATYTLVAEKASLRPLFDDPLRGSTIVTCPGNIQSPGPWRRNATPQQVSGTLVCSYRLAAVTWTTEPTCSSATSMPIELGRRSTSSTNGGRRTPDVLRPGPPRRLPTPTRRTPRRRRDPQTRFSEGSCGGVAAPATTIPSAPAACSSNARQRGSACGAADAGPCGSSAYLFAVWPPIVAGGPLRARPRPPLRSGPKGSQTFPGRSRRSLGKLCAPDLAHRAPRPAQISSARRQKNGRQRPSPKGTTEMTDTIAVGSHSLWRNLTRNGEQW